MKISSKNFFLLMVVLFISTPIIATANYPKTAQTSTKSFVVGTWVASGFGDWEPAIYISLPNNYYIWACLEGLVWTDFADVSHPVLATNWTIYPRPDEGGHTGGVKAIAFSLRQGVTFHDGSEWNADVAKWNLDRSIVISGNLTGNGDPQNRDLFWFDASQWKDDFTPNWNLSWYKDDLFGLGSEIPYINKTEIINPYLINVTFNSWTIGPGYFEGATFTMISMESYSDWYDTPIYGIGEHPDFPQDNPVVFPGHLIGTGPYIFDYYDYAVTSTGHLIKNDYYWNKTALESEGLFSITDVYIRHFADFQSRTTAILTGEIDFIADQAQIPITDHDAVIADPLLEYVPTYLDPGIIDITFKCEEGLNTPTPIEDGYGGMPPKEIFPILTGLQLPDGVNRTVRRALSYSFDYQTYFEVVQDGWGNLSQTCFGLESIVYNPSVPEPYYNVTKAREILLSDPYYAGKAAARGLSSSNKTEDWNDVALSDPIDTHNMMSATGSEEPVFMEAALNDIGFGFVSYTDPNPWINQVATGYIVLYDMFPFIWPNSATNPWPLMNAFFTSKNRVIPYYGYNFCFLANDTIDDLFTQIFFSADPQPLFDQLADELQNYHVPFLYICQYQQGFGINKGWSFTEQMPARIGFSGLPYYAWISGNRITVLTPPIPGYNIELMFLISISALIGIIYLMRRSNLKIN
ncbi:MAG: ABC transporter substrate-binding protein [Candidatus Hodarchaeota archaeon]